MSVALWKQQRWRSTLLMVLLTGCAAIILVAAAWTGNASQVPPVLLVAATIAVLGRFPIHLNPSGEVSLIPVIAIPGIVLIGWQGTVLGTAIGMATAMLGRSPREAFMHGLIRFTSLGTATVLWANVTILGIIPDIGVIIASSGYFVTQILLESLSLSIDEAISWPRAVGFFATASGVHSLLFTLLTIASAFTVRNIPWAFGREVIPVVGAAVALQLYLPRIFRGQEQQRVLAAVAMMAAAIDAKDAYTGDHSASVANLARRTARILGLDEPEAHRVYLAALLHDVGKTVVPPEILQKPGKLTTEEWQKMKQHVEAGAEMLESISGLAEVAPLVAASHERMDGMGYPQGLKGEQIPLGARINLTVDAYNALTTDRPYRAARSIEEALREIEAHAGTQFDPNVVRALRTALGMPSPGETPAGRVPQWLALLRQPSFALLWFGELISFLGDEVFFIAVSLWVYKLTGSITLLATALVAATVGQAALGFVAGALSDRTDRRALIIITDLGRGAVVAALPFIIVRSLPAAFVLLFALNAGAVVFRSAILALIPSVVRREHLPTAVALFQTTERIAEVAGGVLGGAIVLAFGYAFVFYADALTFVVSAVCVALIPLAWRAGLGTGAPKNLLTDIVEGLRYIRHTPVQRFLALLIFPGSLILAFSGLHAPMVIHTARLDAMAYGVTNSALGLGKLVSAVILTGMATRWVSESFVVYMFLLNSLATILFGATTLYPVLIAAAFLFGVGNVASLIGNVTLVSVHAPSEILGRVLGSRQAFINGTKVVSLFAFGRLADVSSPPYALWLLGIISGVWILGIWFSHGRRVLRPRPALPTTLQ